MKPVETILRQLLKAFAKDKRASYGDILEIVPEADSDAGIFDDIVRALEEEGIQIEDTTGDAEQVAAMSKREKAAEEDCRATF